MQGPPTRAAAAAAGRARRVPPRYTRRGYTRCARARASRVSQPRVTLLRPLPGRPRAFMYVHRMLQRERLPATHNNRATQHTAARGAGEKAAVYPLLLRVPPCLVRAGRLACVRACVCMRVPSVCAPVCLCSTQ
ncbi:hypothetical protein EON67_10220 [archaeon]|nr:MAG: hypothetical protein EON67_10220 [archaeon]